MLTLPSAIHPLIRTSVLGFIRALIPDLFLLTLHPLHRQSHLPLHTVTDILNPFYITGLSIIIKSMDLPDKYTNIHFTEPPEVPHGPQNKNFYMLMILKSLPLS